MNTNLMDKFNSIFRESPSNSPQGKKVTIGEPSRDSSLQSSPTAQAKPK